MHPFLVSGSSPTLGIRHAIIHLLGETELGSAGEQPDKGSPSPGRVKDARPLRLKPGGFFAFSLRWLAFSLNALAVP